MTKQETETIIARVLADSSLHLQESKVRALQSRFMDELARVDDGYNGWTNYATWGVALVLSNDELTYNATRDAAQAFKDSAPDHDNVTAEIWTADQAAKFEDWIKDYTERLCGFEPCDDGTRDPSMMAMQVMQAGLAEVDWLEIAESLLSDLDD